MTFPFKRVLAIGAVLACGTGASAIPALVNSPVIHAQVTAARAAPLRTSGGSLVDANGQSVRISGVNWFGLETDSFAPHGLWARNYDDMVGQIAAAGFDTIRLPFSNQLLEPGIRPRAIDFEKNPDLQGLSGLEVMDQIIASANRHGLSVILDRHRPTGAAQSELWYTDQVPESRWIQDWVMLAQRYRGNPAVIGADLHNEPHGPATWGDDNPRTDWRLAAERAGNAILAANPDWLILVQGIEKYNGDNYWWGGNLGGAAQFPVRLSAADKLVYSPHDYGPGVYGQPWFSTADFPNNLPGIWRNHWAYLQQDGIAPVLLGEFGGRSVGEDREGTWQQSLIRFLQSNQISFTYWSWNPDSGDTGGLLQDDWASVNQSKIALLAASGAIRPEAGFTATVAGGTAQGTPTIDLNANVDAVFSPRPVPPGAVRAPGGPFDADLQHMLAGIGGPSDQDSVHREARAHDEAVYLREFGVPWPYAAYSANLSDLH